MDFSLSNEQQIIIDTVNTFVEQELYPHEDEVEKTGIIRPELHDTIKQKAIDLGLYAANMPEELGGAGLDPLTLCLLERELGRANFGLQYIVGRPSNILMAYQGEQIDNYLLPCIRGDKVDCLAMTEPMLVPTFAPCNATPNVMVNILSSMVPNTSSVMQTWLISLFYLPPVGSKTRQEAQRKKSPPSFG